MGFFKEFKDDFSQALGELLPGDDFTEEDEIQVNTLDGELDVEQELSKLDGLLEQVEKKASHKQPEDEAPLFREPGFDEPETLPADEFKLPDITDEVEPESEEPFFAEQETEEKPIEESTEEAVEETIQEEPAAEEPEAEIEQPISDETAAEHENDLNDEALVPDVYTSMKEDVTMDNMETNNTVNTTEAVAEEVSAETANIEITDEVSVITAGTSIKGNMETTGSFEIEGKIEGDIKCNGKLTVIGSVVGNSSSSEFFADSAHVEGEVVSSGTVKVGLGSVIMGNITATSAVIAGAVKGDIDVQGPVVVDTSAVIMGNIKSRSVQINNGAVIEGFCSQCYSDVDVESLFNNKN